jgi:hypothetical protein
MEQTQCPNCKSYKTSNVADTKAIFGCVGIISLVLFTPCYYFLYILIEPPLFAAILIYLCVAGGAIYLIKKAGRQSKENMFECLDCNFKFKKQD